jgi:hypothetical protein
MIAESSAGIPAKLWRTISPLNMKIASSAMFVHKSPIRSNTFAFGFDFAGVDANVGLNKGLRIFIFSAFDGEHRIGKHLLDEQCRVIEF